MKECYKQQPFQSRFQNIMLVCNKREPSLHLQPPKKSLKSYYNIISSPWALPHLL